MSTTVDPDAPPLAVDGPSPRPGLAPCVRGKFLFAGDEKLALRGVTYGPFAAQEDGQGWDEHTVTADFAAMRAIGVNTIRLYTVPPPWLLDAALAHALWVIVGIPWEQHVAFLDQRRARAICARVEAGARACAGHPAVLCIAVGNEIPAAIVRWLGRRRVERFLARLCRIAKRAARDTLITYVNYPGTEYLRVPDADFLAFNVYLEDRDRFAAYLARLQNLADDRPLVLSELGLDSRRNGEDGQASSLAWQLDCVTEAGCAGAVVFAWTDEWRRGGHEILDWDFGLTRRDRTAKPALAEVARRFAAAPAPPTHAPLVSVVVCTHNGASTLADCLDGATTLDYPRYEVIVVDDGSSDASAAIAHAFGAHVITTENRGLSAARNTGLAAARGEIVAYIDDDARPDPHWLTFLGRAFEDPVVAAVGGPNVLPPDSGRVAECVANAPGGPTHVLLSDREAEHLPGCNLAIRREALAELGGFDERFRVAGDDVDVCWRLIERGHRLAFSPGAMVLHRRRATVRGYLRQQRGYGRAEALLERKWPERYSAGGHVGWRGRLYGNGSAQHRGGLRWRVYYGAWGSGAFQPLYGPRRGILESLPLLPEWYLVLALLAGLTAAGAVWTPLLLAAPLLVVALGALLFDAALGAARARFPRARTRGARLRLRLLTALLYVLQPPARLHGRIGAGLVPWRRRGPRGVSLPRRSTLTTWSERWEAPEQRVRTLAEALARCGAIVTSGGDWDRWDLQVRGGPFAAARLRLAVEEHGAGRQLVRVRSWPRLTPPGVVLAALAIAATAAAATLGIDPVLLPLAGLAGLRLLYEGGVALHAARLPLLASAAREEEGVLELAPVEAGG